jgi:Glycosyl transferase family 2
VSNGTVLMSSMRDEGPFVVEWVAHHLVLGFDRILIASNDCSDGTDLLLSALADRGHVSHLNQTVRPGALPQHEAYSKLRAAFSVDTEEWLLVLDTDEFLNIHCGDHMIGALISMADRNVDIIALNAATFGANGPPRWRPKSVTSQFFVRHPTLDWRSAPVKSLTRRPVDFAAIHNHSMVNYRGPKAFVRCMRADGSCFDLDQSVPFWKQLRNFAAKDCRHDFAQYNHYAVKSWDTFLARRDRGRGAAPTDCANDRHSREYYDMRKNGSVEDRTILRYALAVQRKIDEILSDDDISACHDRCVRRYRKKMRGYWASFGDENAQGATPD